MSSNKRCMLVDIHGTLINKDTGKYNQSVIDIANNNKMDLIFFTAENLTNPEKLEAEISVHVSKFITLLHVNSDQDDVDKKNIC